MELKVKHDQSAHQFYVIVDDLKSVLEYQAIDKNTLDYHHTFVPPELRGRHIADEMAKYALNFARDNHLKIIPSCSFVKRYIQMHPEYQLLLK